MTRHDAVRGYRLRHIMVVLLPIVLLYGLLNLGLSMIWGPAPATLRYSELIDPEMLQTIAERVAIVEEQWKNAGPMRPRLAVVLGLSTAREGIDPIQIDQATQGRLRLLNIAASGGSFREMSTYSEALLNSNLQPDVVILAVHPSWLAGRKLRSLPESSLFLREDGTSMRISLRQLKRWVAQQLWVRENYPGIHSELRQAMLGWRAQVRRWMKISLFGENGSPWRVRSLYQDQQAPPDFWRTQLREWALAGWFDPGCYDAQTSEAQALRSLLGNLGGKTPNLVVVMMPEAEALRSHIPSRAAETLIDIIHEVDKRIVILDLRTRLPTAMFRDQAHVNAQGRRVLTQELTVRAFNTPMDSDPTSSNFHIK